MRARVFGETLGCLVRTRLTVLLEVWASLAIWRRVIVLVVFLISVTLSLIRALWNRFRNACDHFHLFTLTYKEIVIDWILVMGSVPLYMEDAACSIRPIEFASG